ncbi:MAG: CPBP family intramembrane glutamic endopeptidase, partial [Candidatus Omnitrophota bacterium]
IRFEPESASDAPDWRMTNVVEFCVLLLFLEIVFYVSWSAAVSLAGLKSFNSDCLLVLSTIFRDVVAAVYIVRVVRGRMGCPVSALGLDGRYLWSKAWIGVKAYLAVIPLLMMCFMVLSVILQRMAYEPPPQKVVQIYLSNSNDNFLAVLTVFVAVVGPALEEIFFRGFIYRVFRKRLGVFWGIAISAAIFALIHFNLVAAVPIFLLGVFLAVLYYRTGSLAAPIAAHITHNLLMVAMTLVFKTITS